ncbi:MAG TPA: CDC48 family AAA ATPase [Synergistales bacterium]|nr:CDC48 family AAA ATPase [Synergistales bacterium]
MPLKVKEAISKDVGRCIARIDPADMKRYGIKEGQIIEIEGKRRTPARVLSCESCDIGHRTIQIDGITRDNAQVGLDDYVTINKIAHSFAESISLRPISTISLLEKEKDGKYIASLLEGLPVSKGDRIRITLFGTRSCDFKVVSSEPIGISVIHKGTYISLEKRVSGPNKLEKISYEDIGGLGPQIQRVREMIELPLRFPQVFDRLGVEPPKGVLLYGPPGTGKTVIARAVANETDVYFTHISGPEIIGKFYGESEERLRKVFEEAQAHSPSIIFIDEIDAIAPKREEMGGEKQVERRVVAQLLALMDGLESRGQIVVIGATNIPNTLDPALRRPGRFDREISIPIPDRKGRHEILQIHTRGMPLSTDVDLERIAEITHGFVGADLEALTKEAAMSTLRQILPNINFEMAEIPYERLLQMNVTMDNFIEALKEVEPSAIREVFVEVPDVTWEDVGGLEEAKEQLKEAVEWPLQHSETFGKFHVHPPTGILIHGKSGTGKTLLAKALANESGVNFISVKGPSLMSKYVGESERAIRDVFKTAKQAAPSILYFDEIESLVPVRGKESGSGAAFTERVIGQFLAEMSGIEELKGVVVLATTNRIDLMDPSLLSSGRFDLVLELTLPNEETRRQIFNIHLRMKPLSTDVSVDTLAKLTENMNGGDINFICKRASMLAIRDYIKSDQKIPPEIQWEHFEKALSILKERSSIKP